MFFKVQEKMSQNFRGQANKIFTEKKINLNGSELLKFLVDYYDKNQTQIF